MKKCKKKKRKEFSKAFLAALDAVKWMGNAPSSGIVQ